LIAPALSHTDDGQRSGGRLDRSDFNRRGGARSSVGTPKVDAATPMPATPVIFRKVLRSMLLFVFLFWLIAIPPFVDYKMIGVLAEGLMLFF